MKYVFFGTPRFAEIVLRTLINADMPPVALVCNPDRPVGRKGIITPPPTKRLVEERTAENGVHIALLQPEKFDAHFLAQLETFRADCFVVAAYAKIIPKAALAVPRLGVLGVHPSLLPKYRGASPIQSVILNGETETGTTIFLMDEKVDHGPIFARTAVPMDSLYTSYLDLEKALAECSGTLLAKILHELAGETLAPQAQDEARATYTKKITTEDSFVPEEILTAAEQGDAEKACAIARKINALTPEPGVWTTRDGKRIKLLAADVENDSLRLRKIQEEGQTPRVLRSS